MGKVKPVQISGKGKIKSPPDTGFYPEPQHPVFCFKYIHKDFGLNKCNDEEKIKLLERVAMLSKMTWPEIQTAPKHGVGSEKIERDSIIPPIPLDLTEDVKHLLALRFDGKKPIVGYRNKFIFHILYIDRSFEVYNH